MAVVAGTRASLSFCSCSAAAVAASSSPRQFLLALPRSRRPYLSLTSPQAAASRGRTIRRRFLVRAARMEYTGVSVGFRAPEFEVIQLPLALFNWAGFWHVMARFFFCES
jgi:hypothetical protein